MKWEYKVLEVGVVGFLKSSIPKDTGIKLDELGAEGWELIRILPIMKNGFWFFGGSYTERAILFFKRQAN